MINGASWIPLCQTAGGNVEIRYNLKLTDISGLSNLEVIGGEVAGPGRGKGCRLSSFLSNL